MTKFKVGDRVLIIENNDIYQNTVATIVEVWVNSSIRDGDYLDFNEGCSLKTFDNLKWFYTFDDIRPLTKLELALT